MSVLISTCQEINKQCTNYSKTKQLYTFGKADRFEKNDTITKNIINKEIIEQKSKYRGASLGYGKKSDFCAQKAKNKVDSIYDFKSDFDRDGNNNSANSLSYSIGRKHNVKKLYDENIKFNYKPDQPGPGFYEPKEHDGTSKYSMKGRNYNYPKKPLVPGSGAYNTNDLNPEGKYYLSGTSNTKGIVFGKNKADRFTPVVKCIFIF